MVFLKEALTVRGGCQLSEFLVSLGVVPDRQLPCNILSGGKDFGLCSIFPCSVDHIFNFYQVHVVCVVLSVCRKIFLQVSSLIFCSLF